MEVLPGTSGAEKENREPESVIVVAVPPQTEEQVISQVGCPQLWNFYHSISQEAGIDSKICTYPIFK